MPDVKKISITFWTLADNGFVWMMWLSPLANHMMQDMNVHSLLSLLVQNLAA